MTAVLYGLGYTLLARGAPRTQHGHPLGTGRPSDLLVAK